MVSIVLLAGCSGSASLEAVPEPAFPQTAQIKGHVGAYGDSTQKALGMPHASERPGWTIDNRGVSGSTAGQLLNGTDGLNRPWAEEMAGSPAELVIINHALNISGGTTTAQYEEHLTELVTIAQAAGKRVILEDPNEAEPHGEFDMHAFAERIEVMRRVATKHRARHCEQPRVPLQDGAHPTPEGYAIKATTLAACIGEAMADKTHTAAQ